ncbi:hypothetical protein MCOR27_008322 [Pyricularia oryzae]|nr:hypothetical protein MCOR01_001075 [Pyricularia oryzae]KAI6289719.1 hypothetical protein MCOR33_011738 [Pyricularia grisea]KAH9430406.1 hypothetical protein MCOR02_010110 [Pyricularia oryzae]KAI6252424.1 hypothetical protein MCOR19_010957 [Pyricularia oryzae]KAI6272510.1 hypothetical protein MCOR27_008322 [Pyricularia oryzae]
MAPLKPHWISPSHPEIQEVIINEAEFTSMSRSRVTLPPFALYAKMSFPPCTLAEEPTYATVQIGRDRHLNLNSDLLYINHSCDPSLIFDTANLAILVGPKGIRAGEELTFFYPSTEWRMAQPFACLCGAATCRGTISGAEAMSTCDLEGVWLNGFIREMLEERDAAAAYKAKGNGNVDGNGTVAKARQTDKALQDAVFQAERLVEATRTALLSYQTQFANGDGGGGKHAQPPNGCQKGLNGGPTRR